jgi:AcrR family transcriptional regulator
MAEKKSAPHKYHHGELRSAIMAVALQMIAEAGLASLSLREIARRIGVTTAAPYHHFKDRQSLLIELAIEAYTQLFAAMSNAKDSANNASEAIEAEAEAYLQFGRDHRAEYAVMFCGEFANHPRSLDMMTIADRSLELVRKSIAESRNLTPTQSTEAAFCLWSLLHGILTLDQNSVLQETVAQQTRLAMMGVAAIVKGFTEGASPSGTPLKLSPSRPASSRL